MGADLLVPAGPLTLDVHISHTGRAPIEGMLRAGWGAPGSRELPPASVSFAAQAKPFRLSEAFPLTVPAPGGPARLHLWLETDGEPTARTFVDAAVVEELNRRGARD